MDDDDPDQQYAWEGEYERPWDAVSQAADGNWRVASASVSRQAQPVHVGVKRGVVRALFVVIDASKQANELDLTMRPNRMAVMLEAAKAFVANFFDQNPISTLAVIVTKDGRADRLTELSCNPRQHLDALSQLGSQSCEGEASLQNALELAREALLAEGRFTPTRYMWHHGWLTLRLEPPLDWGELEELLLDSYRLQAPRRLVRELDRATAEE